MAGDSRKEFVLATAGNFFGVSVTHPSISHANTDKSINNFLDDGNVAMLAALRHVDSKQQNVVFSNKVSSQLESEQQILFFKPRPDVITPDNMHSNVFVSTMIDSPISSLFHAVQKVFMPVLLAEGGGGKEGGQGGLDPQLQTLLMELEAGLGSVLRKQNIKGIKAAAGDTSLAGILTPADEFQYWSDLGNSATGNAHERAVFFSELFKPVSKDLCSPLSALVSLQDCLELVEVMHDTLDEVWRQDDYNPPYPEARMKHLMEIIAGWLCRYVQFRVGELDLWRGPYGKVKEYLRAGMAVCERFINSCETLTTTFWMRFNPNPWHGPKFTPDGMVSFSKRLEELSEVRAVHEQLLRLLSSSEQQELNTAAAFAPFTGINPLQHNPYTEPLWRSAVAQYDRAMQPAQQRVAAKLRHNLRGLEANAQQLLREFQRYKELVKRPALSKELISERETLLGQLSVYIKALRDDFVQRTGLGGKGTPKGKNMPEVVNNIVYVRQLEAKVEETGRVSEELLGDLSGFRQLRQDASSLQEELTLWRQEQFDEWSRDIQAQIDDPDTRLCLETKGKLMELNHDDGKLYVNYGDRLVTLLREVRTLTSLGFPIPAKIQHTANIGGKFYRHSVILKQVAHFYNSIDQQMIKCQQSMMLDSAMAFEKLVKNPKAGSKQTVAGGAGVQVTWDDPEQLEKYIAKLQKAADRLTSDNRRLRKAHFIVQDKVIGLMSTDLLRHQQKWKDGMLEIRQIIANLVNQGFAVEHMTPWKAHWDRQLYKALEHQYQMGLEGLNENLPEIKVELAFRQQKLQYRPPLEEIKGKYFREMKKFISIPNIFKGVGDVQEEFLVFPAIIDRNAVGFITCYMKANDLFRRVDAASQQFKEWVVLGSIDLDEFVDKHLEELSDYEKNFKMLKIRGRDSEKLPQEIKIDCITINTVPVKNAIDDQIARLFDALLNSLRRGVIKDMSAIDTFLNDGMETLALRPQSVEEIGAANAKHGNLGKDKKKVYPLFDAAEQKNKLLRSVAGGGMEQMSNVHQRWDKFEIMMESHQLMIKEQVDVMKNNVESRVNDYKDRLDKFAARWHQLKPGNDAMEGNRAKCVAAVQAIKAKKEEFKEMDELRESLVMDCEHFDMEAPEFPVAVELQEDIQTFYDMWSMFDEFNDGLQKLSDEDWISFRSKYYHFEEYLGLWSEKLAKTDPPTPMTVRLNSEIDMYRRAIPSLKWVRGDPLSPDHWLDLFRLVGLPKGTTLEKLTFGQILSVSDKIVEQTDALKELNSRAQGEVTIREALRELDLWGAAATFHLTEYEDNAKRKISLIKEWKDMVNAVGDNQCLLSSLKDSPYYKAFEDKASIWETRLGDLDEYLQNLNQIQRKWVYLEPIFGRGALPNEQQRFKRVDDDFRSIMSDIGRDPRIISICAKAGMRHTLTQMLDQLGRCQKSLNEFLEEKRAQFPRFYFIGDDDLLEILGQSTNPTVIQTHLKKLFAGIHSVKFDDNNLHILAMHSVDGEIVPLKKPVQIVPEVENWLQHLSDQMRITLTLLLKECVEDSRKSSNAGTDPNNYPSQILCLAEMVRFTEKCEAAIGSKGLRDFQKELHGQLEMYTLVDRGSDDDPGAVVLELKLKALIMDIIHSIEVVDFLLEHKINSTSAWEWQKQLRYYLKSKTGTVEISMVDAKFDYTYEYQGNAPKLVHTPLTDKCYLTLTQGMAIGLGGNPYGPAGTGKTESVKALGGLFGRQVLVFNCDEGIDVKSMGRIFVGLVKCGAWGCFDEFNRLEEAVLSAVSMQIQVIQDAIKCRQPEVQLLGKTIDVDPNSGIFITMNPAGKGYGGRQKLPDNLKALFRPVAMARPNNDLIAEVILFSEGLLHAKSLGRKLVAIFNLSKELLTPQQHYDWGLRALKTILKGCGTLIKALKKALPDGQKVDQNMEASLVVQALRINTLSKLTFSDGLRFDALLRDVFPGTEFKDIDYPDLAQAIREVCAETNLVVNEGQVKKALELYEQLRQRMGVVVVGPSGSGKSTLWRLVQKAMQKTGRVVKLYVMNPKAMPRQQLLGQIDMDTREWFDGVMTYAARQVVKEPIEVQSWIVSDGDIDPEWVESLNSVLDDNRLLTMPSGERIQFGPNVNFLFETHDLSCASPATISRMGMIFLSDEDTDVKALVSSWLNKQDTDAREILVGLLEDYFYRALEWVLKVQGEFVVDTTLVGVVMNGLSHFYKIQSREHFACALVRGLGGNLQESTREKFAEEVFGWIGQHPPDPKHILDTYYDKKTGRLETYSTKTAEEVTMNMLNNSANLPVIMTADVQRGLDYFNPWLKSDNMQPFILVGPEGCGKGLLLRSCFDQLRSTQVAVLHCSAQTNPDHVIQKLNQNCMVVSTTTGRVYRPKDCERLVLYLKDLNLPKPDKWGTSMIIAFLQQLLTYNGFYDSNLEFVGMEGIQIVASMNAGNSLGRHQLNTRFTSTVRICSIGYPDNSELQQIYTEYLHPVLLRLCGERHPVWSSKSKASALAGSMVQVYEQVRQQFTPDDYGHYLFTPRDLSMWVLGLLRYDLGEAASKDADPLLEVWAYEAHRLMRDKLVGTEAIDKFDSILLTIIRLEWSANIGERLKDAYYVTYGARAELQCPAGAPIPPHGKPLGKLNPDDLTSVIEKSLLNYSRENRDLDLLVFREVLQHIARVERVLTMPGGSLLMAGTSGTGRRSSALVVAFMHGMQIHTPKITRGYGVKQFKNDLKNVMLATGVEGEQCLLMLEDHQFVEGTFLELINSLLAAGEVPGLYTPEELEPLLGPLRDQASEEGFRGTLAQYFAQRIQVNLHVALIMDCNNPNFSINCESNPAFFKCCTVMWLDGWSRESMVKMPFMYILRMRKNKLRDEIPQLMHKKKDSKKEAPAAPKKHGAAAGRRLSGGDLLLTGFLHVHESAGRRFPGLATPRRYMAFMHAYESVYSGKKTGIELRQHHLQAGVAKLNEAKELVDSLKKKANKQSKVLAEKQKEADASLGEITTTMQSASDQKIEMEDLKKKAHVEREKLESRKKNIDSELAEIEPLVREAKEAVGNIKAETLGEIRSLRAPPDTIRDILEGVLRLMGTFDTSWNSMKSFLAKRGVKDEIQSFDARKVTPETRKGVEALLKKNGDSFEAKNAKRASAAAAPLAAWVKAQVKFSYVLQSIGPLMAEQEGLAKNLEKAEVRMASLGAALADVDKKVAALKKKFEKTTTEAAKLSYELERSQETLSAAENLVDKLHGEYSRWSGQVGELAHELSTLPMRALLAAGFITYMANAPEDVRAKCLKEWMEAVNVDNFDLRRFMSTESEQLTWKGEGLPSDSLSMENALVILQGALRPFLLDPSSRATEWLKEHLKDQRLEVITQQDTSFSTSLELAVRFGKTLIIQEVDGVEPVLYPLLRGDLVAQGPRFVVQVGDKTIDYNEEFRLFLTTRNPNPDIPPDAASIITEINFTTTSAGLTGQLLANTIQHEKPQLEVRKTELLKQEEDLKIELAKLEESLLEELANAQGNILENKQLLDSLTKTKVSSLTIQEALTESMQLQLSLDTERNAYLPLAENGSKLFFVISDLCKTNNMYRFSLASFLRLFERALTFKQDGSSTDHRIRSLTSSLQNLVYNYVCRSLFKADRLMYALHMVHGMFADLFGHNEWELFTGVLVADVKSGGKDVPSWILPDRTQAVLRFKSTFSKLYSDMKLDDKDLWADFANSSSCESNLPHAVEKKVSLFQQVLLVQAVRPDRLQSAMSKFACKALGMKELAAENVNLKRLLDQETTPTEPILVIISPGTDPSLELEELAKTEIGADNYHQVAMGQGQAELAMKLLAQASKEGEWLCLKNLHLVTAWLPILEKTINGLQPHKNFRLWMTAEAHPRFPSILLQSSLKITYEAPPGVKKNLQRTYESWSPEYISMGGNTQRAQCLFALAWFHAVVQERRNFIPQGWTKFYEFGMPDLRSAAEIINRLCQRTKKSGNSKLPLDYLHGLFELAIYGGRLDNLFDIRVMVSYLQRFFHDSIIGSDSKSSAKKLGPLKMPKSATYRDYIDTIETLPEFDKPSYFGLPENIDRSSQRIISSGVISALRILKRADVKASKFDKDVWATELGPILQQWKKLNSGQTLISQKATAPSDKSGTQLPVDAFILLERYNAIRLLQSVHASLANLSKVIRGTQLLTKDTSSLAEALLNQETPMSWLSKWDGPEEPMLYLVGLVARAIAIQAWVDKGTNLLRSTLDLAELFHPDTFLNALRQQTAREMKCSMDSLKFVTTWKQEGIPRAKLSIKLGGIQLEGCTFDGHRLSENQRDSPTFAEIPPCVVAWIATEEAEPYTVAEMIILPLYTSGMRDGVVTRLGVPCGGNQDTWLQAGAALFLKAAV